MKLVIFGAAALAAVMIPLCAGAREAPYNPARNGTAVEAPAVDTMTTGSLRKDDAAGKPESSALVADPAPGDGERGSLASFFKAAAKTGNPAGKAIRSTKSGTSSARGAYSTLISRYASAHGVPVALAHAVVRVESNFRANARGAAGEIGLMQLKLSTARMMGYRGSRKGLYHPETNIKYGMKYLAKAQSLSGGSTCGTILKYNAGHGAKRMNPVSARYCAKVKRLM